MHNWPGAAGGAVRHPARADDGRLRHQSSMIGMMRSAK
jgi:hypothetical protein